MKVRILMFLFLVTGCSLLQAQALPVNTSSVSSQTNLCKQLFTPQFPIIGGKFKGFYQGELALYYKEGSPGLSGYYEQGGGKSYYRVDIDQSTCDASTGHVVIHWKNNDHETHIEGNIISADRFTQNIQLTKAVFDGWQPPLGLLQLNEWIR